MLLMILLNKQPLDGTVLDSGSDSIGHVADRLLESQKLSVLDLNVAAKEETQSPCITHTENCTTINTSCELLEKKSNSSETVKLDNTDAKDQIERPLALAADRSGKNKVANNHVLETTRGKQRAKEQDYSPKDKIVIQSSPSKSAGKRMLKLEMVKVKEHAMGYLNKKKKLKVSGLKIISEENQEQSSISTEDVVILDSSPMPVEERVDHGKKVKLANTISKIQVSRACNCKQTTGLSKEMKQLRKSGFKVNGHEVEEYLVFVDDKDAISNSSLVPGCNGSVSKPDKPASAMIKIESPDTLRHATDLDRSRDNSAFLLGALSQKKSLNFDIDQKLCDIAVEATHKCSMKETKVSSTDKLESSSLLKGQGKRKDPLQLEKVKIVALNNTKHSALTSLIDLQAERAKMKTSLQLKGGKMQLGEREMAASDEKLDTNLSMVPQGKKAKLSFKSNPPNNQECNPISKGNVSNSSLSPNASGQDCRVQSKIVPRFLLEAEDKGPKLDDTKKSISSSQKKCKKASSLPMVVEMRSSILQIEFSKLHETTDGTGKKGCSISDSESCSAVDSCIRVSLRSAISDLKGMKLSDLRAIAKEQQLTKYSKLRKDDLVEKIVNRLYC
ncbi:hypothetical protein SLEP1_g3894 [Rubroshorea leprosula]|uniref:Rho termination factor-like N-terminal domain-containing protein n=1 Tax=Rubroshorea leprosula TaxID=152421 RepID=A0AAV5HWB5_9ROSI|nr:hypothetical protein SLEP1_g3894 [Rubroshorea leprosula]